MKNKIKGFTLVELLATITILATVLVIAVPSFIAIYNKFSTSYYKSMESVIKLSANDYFTNNRVLNPKYIGEESKVDVSELVSDNYLSHNIQGKNEDEECDGYGKAIKTSKGKYKYYGCVKCTKKSDRTKVTYSSDSGICSVDDEFVVPPSNGLISLPSSYSVYDAEKSSDTLIKVVNAVTYEKTEDRTTRPYTVTRQADMSRIVSPISYEVIDKGSVVFSTTNKTDIVTELERRYGPVTDQTSYETYVNNIIKNKVKIKYYYNNEKTLYKRDSIIKRSGKAPSISINLNRKDLNGIETPINDNIGGAVGVVNLSDISWTNNTINAAIVNETQSIGIDKYYCSTDGVNYFECIGTKNTNGNINLEYINENHNIKTYASSVGGLDSNVLDYAVKTDSEDPKLDIVLKYNNASESDYDSNWTKGNIYRELHPRDNLTNASDLTFHYKDADGNWQPERNIATYTYDRELNNYTDTFKVCDLANNCITPSTITLNIDKTKPTLDIILTYDDLDGKTKIYNSVWINRSVHRELKPSDNLTDTKDLTIKYQDSSGNFKIEPNIKSFTYEASLYNGFKDKFQVCDLANNCIEKSTDAINIDKYPPSISGVLFKRTKTSKDTYPKLEIKYTINDGKNGSGIIKIYDIFSYDPNRFTKYENFTSYTDSNINRYTGSGITSKSIEREFSKTTHPPGLFPSPSERYRNKIAVKDAAGNEAVYWTDSLPTGNSTKSTTNTTKK